MQRGLNCNPKVALLGDMGKKIHSGRSRNDQVLVDLKLFTRHELREVVERVDALFRELQKKSEQYKNVLMPGYTHLQIAMPSSFGLWFGARIPLTGRSKL
jgi:argininosuccinate lyase